MGSGMRAGVRRDFAGGSGNTEVEEFNGATGGFFSYELVIGAIGRDTFFHKVKVHVLF